VQYFSVKNLEAYNHGTKNVFPWVKIYKSLLTSYDFMSLSPTHRWVFIGLILLCSGSNRLPLDDDFLKQQLGIDGDLDLTPLFERGMIVRHSGRPTVERVEGEQRERRGEGEKKRRSPSTSFPEEWKTITEVDEEIYQYGLTQYQLSRKIITQEFEKFRNYKLMHQAQHKDWRRAFFYWLSQVRGFSKQELPVTRPRVLPPPPTPQHERGERSQEVGVLVEKLIGRRSMDG